MRKEKNTITRTINYVCIVMMLVMLAMQFVPYWQVQDETTSVAEYGWLPEHFKALTKHFKTLLDNKSFDARNAGTLSGFMLAGAVLYTFFGIKNARKEWPLLIPVALSAFGLFSYFMFPEFKESVAWSSHIAVYTATFVIAILPFILLIARKLRKK